MKLKEYLTLISKKKQRPRKKEDQASMKMSES